MKVFASEKRQFVCILDDGGHPDGSRPIVVEMSVLVGEDLKLVGRHSVGVVDHVVAGRGDGALPD